MWRRHQKGPHHPYVILHIMDPPLYYWLLHIHLQSTSARRPWNHESVWMPQHTWWGDDRRLVCLVGTVSHPWRIDPSIPGCRRGALQAAYFIHAALQCLNPRQYRFTGTCSCSTSYSGTRAHRSPSLPRQPINTRVLIIMEFEWHILRNVLQTAWKKWSQIGTGAWVKCSTH